MLGMNMSNQTQQALYLQLDWFGLTASVVRTPTVVGSKTVTRFLIIIKLSGGKTMAILNGVAKWASITTPNTRFEPVYTLDLIVEEDIANDFASRGHKVKQHDEGPALVIKRKVNGPNGMIRSAPRLLDKNKQEINVAVGNGSKVRVQYNEYSGEGSLVLT